MLIHIDTEIGARDLLNNLMAYVAVSRGAHDAQILTSDREKLPKALGRDISHESALERKDEPAMEQTTNQVTTRMPEPVNRYDMGLSF